MNISQDLKSHFSKFKHYTTPTGITFYDKKDYDMYMKFQKEPIKTSPLLIQPSCDFSNDTLVLV